MPPSPENLTGRRFGRLVVTRLVERGDHRKAIHEARCDCGVIRLAYSYKLKRGKARNCGSKTCSRASRKSVEERFFEKVCKDAITNCWNWTGTKTKPSKRAGKGGYGHFNRGPNAIDAGEPRLIYAHIWAWEQVRGPIPEGLQVLHECDNPSCVNVEHLSLGTQTRNMIDCQRRTRPKTSKLTERDVLDIRNRSAEGESVKTLATKFGVSWQTIWKATGGQQWTWVDGPIRKPIRKPRRDLVSA